MCKLFSKYEKEIQNYCEKNGLSFEKASKLPQCWRKNDIWLQYHDHEKGKNGLQDETPAPIVLKISIRDNVVSFEQTEYTKEYLS